MAKNLKGGYQIISLAMINLLASGGNTIKGIYNKIEGSYKKPILLEGINIGGAEKHAIYVIPEVSGDDYILKGVYGYDITIDDDDKVTVMENNISSVYTFEESLAIQNDTQIVEDELYKGDVTIEGFSRIDALYSTTYGAWITPISVIETDNGLKCIILLPDSTDGETIVKVKGVKA